MTEVFMETSGTIIVSTEAEEVSPLSRGQLM